MKFRLATVALQSGDTIQMITDGAFRYWQDRDGYCRFARDLWPDDGVSYPHGKRRTFLQAVRAARATLEQR